jgi:hypothetical protein
MDLTLHFTHHHHLFSYSYYLLLSLLFIINNNNNHNINMPEAGAVPPSLVRLGITVLLTLTIVKTFPQYLPQHALLYVFVRLLAVQLLLLAVWKLAIYPFFVTPLRHLPGPGLKVRFSSSFSSFFPFPPPFPPLPLPFHR